MYRLLVCSSLIGLLVPCVGSERARADTRTGGAATKSAVPAASKPAQGPADDRTAANNAELAAANKVDLEKLQGRWKLREARIKGGPVAALEGLIVTFNGNKLTGLSIPAKERSEFEFRIDATTTPKRLDYSKEPLSKAAMRDCTGAIYSIDGNRLVIVSGNTPRPTRLERDAEKNAAYMVFEKIPDEKRAK